MIRGLKIVQYNDNHGTGIIGGGWKNGMFIVTRIYKRGLG